MKINFPILDEAITIENATILAIKDVKIFAQLVRSFYQYEEDGDVKLYDENFKSLNCSDIMLVTDIMGFEVNKPATVKKIQTDIENQFNDKPEVKSEIERLSSKITELIVSECLENELDLAYDEPSLLSLIKILDIRIDSQSLTLFDKMFEILQIYNYLSKKRLLICINTLSYFETEEIQNIMEYVQLGHQPVLFLEPNTVKGISHYVLDDDFYLDKE